MKACSQCGVVQDLDQYPKTYHKRKNGASYGDGRRANCRICENKRRKKSYDNNPLTRMFMNAKSRCRQYDIEFNLELTDLQIPEFCPILGIKLELGWRDNYPFAPSIDRIDSTKGYVKGNVAVVSLLANRMKTNATLDQCLAFALNIEKYLLNNKN
jgi:hypothetical protein